jgi:hypothetical protein
MEDLQSEPNELTVTLVLLKITAVIHHLARIQYLHSVRYRRVFF